MSREKAPLIPDDLLDDLLKAASKDSTHGRLRAKNDWIRKQRALFDPSPRQPCHICQRFAAISQAHHVIPLAEQYDRGFKKADHEHIWLCPNHHTVIHRFLSSPDIEQTAAFRLLEGLNRQQVVAVHAVVVRSRKGLPT